ncbi:TRAP transporter substrate-binding protein [uncultured Jannaschia sp.]|uniref:TRAP transporter substrate-binding protein n=1 Tax=uncultured Jannaschia sp. TaxID=293347 RepID=UPI00262B2E4B|nr:TRAP transporter substrate-binding protein [uncultured Jannaschia sp.]
MTIRARLGQAALALCLAATTAAAQETWVMASGYPEDSFFTKTIRQFIEEVESAADGELTIDLRPNGELIKLDAIRRAVQSGQVQLGEIRFGVYGNESPMYTLDSLPGLASDYEEAHRLMEAQDPWFDAAFEEMGMEVLTYMAWPGQGFFTNFEVTDGSEFDGVSLRIYSPATQRLGELLGFDATILPFAEVPQAFSTGLIESLFTSAQTGNDIQAWDYVDHFTYTGTSLSKNAIIVNARALSRLSPELQEAIREAGARATETAWQLSQEAADATVQVLVDNGMSVADGSPELQAKIDEISGQMLEEFRGEAAEDEIAVLDAYLATSE